MIQNNRKLDLTVRNILLHTSKKELIETFFGTNKIYGSFSSPLRNDEHPSFSISRKNFKYKDHVSNETGDVFDLISKYHNVSFIEALGIAARSVGIDNKFIMPTGSTYNGTRAKPEIKGFVKGHTFDSIDLNVTVRELEDYDIEYWGKYGITKNILKLGKVFPISHYHMNSITYVAAKYSYAFFEKKDGKVTIKVYQPFNEFGKWINNNTYDVWELFFLIPKKGKYLIINSSRKDCLAVIANMKIPSTCLQAEGILPKKHVLQEVVSRFDYVFLLYDNDKKSKNWGQINAQKLLELDDRIINLVIPDEYKSKDYTDLIIETSVEEATSTLFKLMKNAIEESTKV